MELLKISHAILSSPEDNPVGPVNHLARSPLAPPLTGKLIDLKPCQEDGQDDYPLANELAISGAFSGQLLVDLHEAWSTWSCRLARGSEHVCTDECVCMCTTQGEGGEEIEKDRQTIDRQTDKGKERRCIQCGQIGKKNKKEGQVMPQAGLAGEQVWLTKQPGSRCGPPHR